MTAVTPDTVRTRPEPGGYLRQRFGQARASQAILRRRSTRASGGSGRKSITHSSASSASLWPKAGRSLDMFVSALPEALILIVPPVYRRARSVALPLAAGVPVSSSRCADTTPVYVRLTTRIGVALRDTENGAVAGIPPDGPPMRQANSVTRQSHSSTTV